MSFSQEAALELYTQFNCCVVFLGAELKERYYKGARLTRQASLPCSICRPGRSRDLFVACTHASGGYSSLQSIWKASCNPCSCGSSDDNS